MSIVPHLTALFMYFTFLQTLRSVKALCALPVHPGYIFVYFCSVDLALLKACHYIWRVPHPCPYLASVMLM